MPQHAAQQSRRLGLRAMSSRNCRSPTVRAGWVNSSAGYSAPVIRCGSADRSGKVPGRLLSRSSSISSAWWKWLYARRVRTPPQNIPDRHRHHKGWLNFRPDWLPQLLHMPAVPGTVPVELRGGIHCTGGIVLPRKACFGGCGHEQVRTSLAGCAGRACRRHPAKPWQRGVAMRSHRPGHPVVGTRAMARALQFQRPRRPALRPPDRAA